MKFKLIQKNRSKYPVEKMCKILKVSKSGYYKWLKQPQPTTDTKLLTQISAIYKASRETYGYLRITAKLKQTGVLVNKKKVARIMRENGIYGLQIKKFRPKTTISDHNLPVSPNLLQRDFHYTEINKAWVSDITYISTGSHWSYLCSIIDLGSREVVGWSFEKHMRTALIVKALNRALKRRGLDKIENLIFHSDRGSQYASKILQEYLKQIGACSSMSAKANCFDNAVAESFFATLKREEVNRKNYQSFEEAKSNLFDYIEIFYNRQRLHSSLGNKIPAEAVA